MALRVGEDVAAERRAHRVLHERALERAIEAGTHAVVAVQEMHQMAAGALQRRREIRRHPGVARLAEELDAAAAELVDDRARIVAHRMVVDDLDLHDLGTGVLREHAPERLAQVRRAVEGRDHHRPERPPDAVRHGRDDAAIAARLAARVGLRASGRRLTGARIAHVAAVRHRRQALLAGASRWIDGRANRRRCTLSHIAASSTSGAMPGGRRVRHRRTQRVAASRSPRRVYSFAQS